MQLAERAPPAQPPPAHAPRDMAVAAGAPAAAPQRWRSGDPPPAPRLVLPPRPTNLRGLTASPKRKRKAAAAGAVPHGAPAGAAAGLGEGAMGSDTPPGPPAARALCHRKAEGSGQGLSRAWAPLGLPRVATGGLGAGASPGMQSPHPHPSSRGSSDSAASPWARAVDLGYEVGASPARAVALPPSAFAVAAAQPLAGRGASGRLSAAASLDLDSALREAPTEAGYGSDTERLGGAPQPPARMSQGSAPAAERPASRVEGGRMSVERAASVTTSAKSMCAPCHDVASAA